MRDIPSGHFTLYRREAGAMAEKEYDAMQTGTSEEKVLLDKKEAKGASTAKRVVVAGLASCAVVGVALLLRRTPKMGELKLRFAAKQTKPIAEAAIKAVALAPDVALEVPEASGLIEVERHVRNLHNGWKASPDAIARASAFGIELGPNQTFVRNYSRAAA